MGRYGILRLKGDINNLLKFEKTIDKYVKYPWKFGTDDNKRFSKTYITFKYDGNELPKATVYLETTTIKELKFEAPHIINSKENLNPAEYNGILEKCLNECIINCAEDCNLDYSMDF